MSDTADVRAFYGALGIALPASAEENVTVRCFADPEAHTHSDRSASCSINLRHGAWQCWGCGARGGAYDAALAQGHSPASAMDLLVEHGLAERRSEAAASPRKRPRGAETTPDPAKPGRGRSRFRVSDAAVLTWCNALLAEDGHPQRVRLCRERLWSPKTMRELELGYDGSRITIPIRNAEGRLSGLLRYQPGGRPKMLAAPGTRLGLIPHPAQEHSRRVLLVEGPPDMIAARSRGWPAIAVPGDHAWRADWAPLLAGREVIVVMDSDQAGRAAAARVAADLTPLASARVIDLAPCREDGFDLTDWLHDHPQRRRVRWTPSSSSRPTIRP